MTNEVIQITSFEFNKSITHDLRCITDSIRNLHSIKTVIYQFMILLIKISTIMALCSIAEFN